MRDLDLGNRQPARRISEILSMLEPAESRWLDRMNAIWQEGLLACEAGDFLEELTLHIALRIADEKDAPIDMAKSTDLNAASQDLLEMNPDDIALAPQIDTEEKFNRLVQLLEAKQVNAAAPAVNEAGEDGVPFAAADLP